jgi:hypothetical protein
MRYRASSAIGGLITGSAFLALMSAAQFTMAAGGGGAAAGGGGFGGGARFGNAPAGSPLGNVQLELQGNPANLLNQPSGWSNVPASISGYSTGGYQNGFQNGDRYGAPDVRGLRGLSGYGSGYYDMGYYQGYSPGYQPAPVNTTPTYGTLGRPGFQGFQDGAFEIGGFPQGLGTPGGR